MCLTNADFSHKSNTCLTNAYFRHNSNIWGPQIAAVLKNKSADGNVPDSLRTFPLAVSNSKSSSNGPVTTK